MNIPTNCNDGGETHNLQQILGEDGTPEVGFSTEKGERKLYLSFCTKCGGTLDIDPWDSDDDDEEEPAVAPHVEYKSPEPAQSPEIPSPYMKT